MATDNSCSSSVHAILLLLQNISSVLGAGSELAGYEVGNVLSARSRSAKIAGRLGTLSSRSIVYASQPLCIKSKPKRSFMTYLEQVFKTLDCIRLNDHDFNHPLRRLSFYLFCNGEFDKVVPYPVRLLMVLLNIENAKHCGWVRKRQPVYVLQSAPAGGVSAGTESMEPKLQDLQPREKHL